jgi:integrase
MASLQKDNLTGRYRIRFRFGGQEFKRSLKSNSLNNARRTLANVEETLQLIERGQIEIPLDADPAKFIISGGKLNGKLELPQLRTVQQLFKNYRTSLPKNTKEDSTLLCEKIHMQHLQRFFKPSTVTQTITVQHLQSYVVHRLEQEWRGRPIRPDTVKKEISTFRLIWNWAVEQGYLQGAAQTKGIKYPKIDEKRPFMTWNEIERIVARGGLTKGEESGLWASLFLTTEQIEAILKTVKAESRHPFIYPMFVFAAHTGIRRSEILRSRIDDFDFDLQTVLIREKKKSRTHAITYRRVPMTRHLFEVFSDWFQHHPGGQFSISPQLETRRGKTREDFGPLTPSEARDHFRRTLKGSKWEKVRGFHVFRHSFASNAARSGVAQGMIDEWMGHQTEEMRRRYRHLFPEQQRTAIEAVFGHTLNREAEVSKSEVPILNQVQPRAMETWPLAKK